MSKPRPHPFLLALIVSAAFGAAGVSAQAPAAPVKVPAVNANIEFYLAHGEADACGRGCNEWIVAEGKIDLDAVMRLRTLLLKLGGRRPPLYVHSPGGSVSGSIALGRLIREQRLTVSVAHTVAVGCDRERLSRGSLQGEETFRAGGRCRVRPDGRHVQLGMRAARGGRCHPPGAAVREARHS